MAQRVVAVVIGLVGLYLNIWHSSPLPGNHFAVFGPGFGAQHWLHSIIGLALLIVAAWLWIRTTGTRTATA